MKLLALKFYNLSNPLNAATACQAIDYAVTSGAKVVNLSWHVAMYSQVLFNHIKLAKDVLFVAAAGNEGTNNDKLKIWPACYTLPNLVSVMATKPIPVKAIDQFDDKPGFSNYGLDTVHIAAPGVRVLSTHYGFTTQASPVPKLYGDVGRCCTCHGRRRSRQSTPTAMETEPCSPPTHAHRGQESLS